MIYFDFNATAPVMREAREAWLETTEKIGGNPSSMHQYGARAGRAMSDAREKLAALIGCHPLDIVWTSGATEANNTVMHHFARTLDAKSEVWVSAIEHPCVMESSQHYFGKRARQIPVTREGVIDLDWLTVELADTRPGLVAVMAANNETGVIQPWREVLAICRQYKVPFFCDRQNARQGTRRMRFPDRRGAQIRRSARRGLPESSASHPDHSPAPRRPTGRRPAGGHGKCRDHCRHARRVGHPGETDGAQRTHFARRVARQL
jgi:hypothetical protein